MACCHVANRHEQQASWSDGHKSSHPPPSHRDNGDKASLDIFWLKDESLSDSDNLPAPEVIAAEIVEDLEAALEQFRQLLADFDEAGAAQRRTEAPAR